MRGASIVVAWFLYRGALLGGGGTRIFGPARFLGQGSNQVLRTVCRQTRLFQVCLDPLARLVRWVSVIKATRAPSQEVPQVGGNLGDQNFKRIFWFGIPQSILDETDVIIRTHILYRLGHKVPRVCPTF